MRLLHLLIATCILLTSCGSNDTQKARQQIESWNATLRIMDEQQSRGRLPRAYVEHTHGKAQKEIAEAQKKLQ